MENIPFENLDVIVGRKINLNYKNLYNKIVTNERGGYCFELNILFSQLLKAIGFTPKPVLGRVWLRNPKKIPPRNHLAHLIEIDYKVYVTDVGFGGLTTRIPLDINETAEINDKDGVVRILPFGENQFMLQRKVDNDWSNQYSFENVDISEEDIEISNYYMSTNHNSHFIKDNFIGKFTQNGRVGLFNTQMSIRNGINTIDKKHIPYGSEWIETLKTKFGLRLDFSQKELNKLFQ
jgi:N-hydroxyarylamine O-acetyltransferase